jgi:5-methyltetrahydropteroyltriglutamate--homocysteine methyltransferase
MLSDLPLLPTTVIGSYSLPPWLEQVRRLHAGGTVCDEELEEAHDNAVRSAVKDQELAGIDLLTDGELRRETMVYFFSSRIDGFDMSGRDKAIGNLDPSITMPDPIVTGKVRRKNGLGLDRHFRFLQQSTTRSAKVCVTGPHMLAKRASNDWYKNERDLIVDLAGIIREELQRLAGAGCRYIQIDEPVWVGYPEDLPWLVTVFNDMVRDIDAVFTLHLCYGNYQLKRLFHGQYDDLFPVLLGVNAPWLSMEFAVNGMSRLELLDQLPASTCLVAGVIDVKDADIETPELVADRIRMLLRHVPPERLLISPDCGMKFMPRDRACAKLRAMVDGTRIVRAELGLPA